LRDIVIALDSKQTLLIGDT